MINFLIVIAIGFLVGRYLASESLVAQKGKPQAGLLCPYLDPQICSDIEKYKIEKEQETRYQIAQNILSKMIKIFLADMGMRAAEKKFELESYSQSNTYSQSEVPQPQIPGPEISKTAVRVLPVDPVKPTPQKKKNPENPAIDWYGLQELLQYSSNGRYLKEILGKLTVKDPGPYLFHSRPVKDKMQIEPVVGQFEGRIELDSKIQGVWKAKIQIQLQSAKNQKVYGDYSLELSESKSSQPFLTASGRGNFRDIRLPSPFGEGVTSGYARNDTAIILKGNDDLYIQAFQSRSGLVGNVYQRQDRKFKKIGIMNTRRK